VHDPGKIIADLAVAVALGGDCLADVAMLRAEPQLFGPVASDPVAPRLALAQLPARLRRQVLIRADSGGGTHSFPAWLTRPGRRLPYSAGMTITEDIASAILKIPARAWTPAYDSEREVRDGAWAAEVTGMLDLSSWPKGMRLIVRKERPHPGAQLRFTDIDGHRLTCFATSTRGGQLADLELRHRRRAPLRGPEGSAAPRTPACATSPSRATPRTRSGCAFR